MYNPEELLFAARVFALSRGVDGAGDWTCQFIDHMIDTGRVIELPRWFGGIDAQEVYNLLRDNYMVDAPRTRSRM